MHSRLPSNTADEKQICGLKMVNNQFEQSSQYSRNYNGPQKSLKSITGGHSRGNSFGGYGLGFSTHTTQKKEHTLNQKFLIKAQKQPSQANTYNA